MGEDGQNGLNPQMNGPGRRLEHSRRYCINEIRLKAGRGKISRNPCPADGFFTFLIRAQSNEELLKNNIRDLETMRWQSKDQNVCIAPLMVGLLFLGLCAKTSLCAAADSPSVPAAMRGVAREDEPAPVVAHYRAAWAVIVGINYRDLTGTAAVEIPPLADRRE